MSWKKILLLMFVLQISTHGYTKILHATYIPNVTGNVPGCCISYVQYLRPVYYWLGSIWYATCGNLCWLILGAYIYIYIHCWRMSIEYPIISNCLNVNLWFCNWFWFEKNWEKTDFALNIIKDPGSLMWLNFIEFFIILLLNLSIIKYNYREYIYLKLILTWQKISFKDQTTNLYDLFSHN